jgi:hypothetical protein
MRSTRLVGREADLELLRDSVALAREREPRLVVVDGQAGIGKTRLVEEAVAVLREPTDLVAVGPGLAMAADSIPPGRPGRATGEAGRRPHGAR